MLVRPEQLALHLRDPAWVVFDCRHDLQDHAKGRRLYDEGHVPGARFAAVETDLSGAKTGRNGRHPLPEDAARLYLSNDHMGNFFDCVRSRKLPICDVETGHRSATMCHLGAISLRTGFKLNWDYKKEHFTGEHAKVANTYVSREMRKPYDFSFCG